MAQPLCLSGESIEEIGTCATNTEKESCHKATVQYSHLWTYAQQAALIALSERDPRDQRYQLIKDPERRAKRIAASYADLYFESKKNLVEAPSSIGLPWLLLS